MTRLFTRIPSRELELRCSLQDRIMLLGSCFSDEMAHRMKDAGYTVCANPFGTLYNPASIAAAVRRLDSAEPYTGKDCVRMGAGTDLICSFEHHSSFARPTAEEFLEKANSALEEASRFWKSCNKVIITLGTAYVWEHNTGIIVGNCLKRNAEEFRHYMLDEGRCTSILSELILSHPDKGFIFTVSPIRHLSQGARSNTLSKSTLHLAVHKASLKAEEAGLKTAYFPAWELMYDELRDYRFYAEDLCHPSKTAVDLIWERFLECNAGKDELEKIERNEKEARRKAHLPLSDRQAQGL